MTTRLQGAIVTDAHHLLITEISRRYGLAWHTVMTLVGEWIEEFVHTWSDAPIPEFRSVLKALAQWLPEICVHRCGHVTNGRFEGTTNKLGILKGVLG